MASYDVNADLNKIVKQLAERRGSTADETVEYLITKGVQKWNAEHKWAAANKPEPKAKKAKAPKAKAKAKGPIARKGGAKKAAKAPKAAKAGGAEAIAL